MQNQFSALFLHEKKIIRSLHYCIIGRYFACVIVHYQCSLLLSCSISSSSSSIIASSPMSATIRAPFKISLMICSPCKTNKASSCSSGETRSQLICSYQNTCSTHQVIYPHERCSGFPKILVVILFPKLHCTYHPLEARTGVASEQLVLADPPTIYLSCRTIKSPQFTTTTF